VDEPEEQLEARISAELARRIGAGDSAAEAQLVERYQRGVLYLLKRRTRDVDLALDLRQDTFRIAIEKLRAKEISEPERIGAFVRGIAVNLAIADARKTNRRATTADSDAVDLVADPADGPADAVASEQTRAAVRALLDDMSVPRDRDILLRFYVEDEDKESICTALGVDSAHFNRVLFRAKQRFRALLERAEKRGGLRLVGRVRDSSGVRH
jgi:RNA polymerase sigma-70 factor (ECF subfamily)